MNELKERVISASKWSGLTEVVTKAISPLVFVILARILTPEDFGVVATASIIVAFSQIFSDRGLVATIIQTKEDIKKVSNIVFWGNIIISVIIYLIIFLFADVLANLFNDHRIAVVLRVQSLIIVFNSLSATQIALFRKELNFKVLFWIQLLTIGAPAIVSVPLAFVGFGYWALVGGYLAGSVLKVIILLIITKWTPSFVIEFNLLKKIFFFGGFVTLEGLLGWFYNWGDSAVIGAFLNVKELGVYRTGSSIVILAFSLLLSPITPVLFSYFSKIEKGRIASTLLRVNRLVATISFFLGMSLFVFADSIELYVFGDKWAGVSDVIRAIGIINGFGWYFGSNYEAFRAMGKPKVNVAILIISLAYYIPVYIFIAPMGIKYFLYARLCILLLDQIPHVFAVKQFLEISPFEWFKNMIDIFLMTLSFGLFISIIKIKSNSVLSLFLFFAFSLLYWGYVFSQNKDFRNLLTNAFKGKFTTIKEL